MILVYTTCKDKEEAKRISKKLLEKKLIACANFFPIESMYWWNNKITNDNEYVLLLKTLETNFEKIKKEIQKIHSYTIPCILKINIESSKEYSDWVKKSC